MSRDDIIRMAREAHHELVTQDYPGHLGQLDPWTLRLLERFAALVAAQERESYEHTLALQQRSYEREIEIEVEAEREACAKVCDQVGDRDRDSHAYDAAAAIRARGQKMERKPANAHDKAYSEVELADAYQKGWNDAMLRSSLGMARRQA